jgi:aspartate dehydrogenase
VPLLQAGISIIVLSAGVDLERLDAARILFEGPAREGVPHFPQNVNIAAVLSLAGIGMERTRLRVVADPALKLYTHTIRVAGPTGRFTVVLENVPTPDNPKTSWLACCSAVDALRSRAATTRYGS